MTTPMNQEQIAAAAKAYVALRGQNPDELIQFPDDRSDMMSTGPRWHAVVQTISDLDKVFCAIEMSRAASRSEDGMSDAGHEKEESRAEALSNDDRLMVQLCKIYAYYVSDFADDPCCEGEELGAKVNDLIYTGRRLGLDFWACMSETDKGKLKRELGA